MKKFLKIFLGVLFAALLLGTFVFLWQKTRPVKVVYTIVQPKLDTLKQFVVATGKVEPRDEVLIKPQISGIVSDVYKEAGQMVRKGEVIATVKVVPEMGQLSSAESRVSVAEISLAQTRREFGRTETLHDKGVVSDEEFEQGRTDLQKAEEELQNAKENLEIVKNGITSRYKELSNTQIRSTIDGMILDVPIKVGNSVIQANTFNDGYDHRLRSRHVEHALPGQRRRNGRRQVARRHARETDDRRPAERRTGCQPGVRFAQSDRG